MFYLGYFDFKKLKFIDRNGPIIAHAEDANSLMHITQDHNKIASVELRGIVQDHSFIHLLCILSIHTRSTNL